jgi:hypothetical protein
MSESLIVLAMADVSSRETNPVLFCSRKRIDELKKITKAFVRVLNRKRNAVCSSGTEESQTW